MKNETYFPFSGEEMSYGNKKKWILIKWTSVATTLKDLRKENVWGMIYHKRNLVAFPTF